MSTDQQRRAGLLDTGECRAESVVFVVEPVTQEKAEQKGAGKMRSQLAALGANIP